MTAPTNDRRDEYIAGLMLLADALESNPDAPLPAYGDSSFQPVRWVLTLGTPEDQKAAIRSVIRALGGTWTKDVSGVDNDLFTFDGRCAGLYVDILTHRDTVCRRVVTGTSEVTKMVPSPDAPLVAVTETVEDVEWICEPLLAEATA